MLKKSQIDEFNSHAEFLRLRELEMHQKKIQEIQNRKNKYLSSHLEDNPQFIKTFSSSKKKLSQQNVVQTFIVDAGNKYLMDRLYHISSRDNQYNANSKQSRSNSPQNEVFVRPSNYLAHRKFEVKKIGEENLRFSKRIVERAGSIEFDKLEEDYTNSRKMLKNLTKFKNKHNKSVRVNFDDMSNINKSLEAFAVIKNNKHSNRDVGIKLPKLAVHHKTKSQTDIRI